jgi:hypothetical protein
MKEKLKNPFVRQYALEILLPLIGYYLFEWSLTIIALFYFVDYICSEIAKQRRIYKVYKINSSKLELFVLSVVVGVLFFAVSIIFSWIQIQEINVNNYPEMIAEVMVFVKEELWFFLPLVYLMYHLKDTFTFYMPRRFLNFDYKKMVQFQMIESLSMTILIIAGVSLWNYYRFQDEIVLFGFMIVKVAFDLIVSKWLDKKSQLTA